MTAGLAVDIFKRYLLEGLTHSEAAQNFNQEHFREALFEGEGPASPEQQELLTLFATAGREDMNARDMEQAIELWLAGWTSETPHESQTDVMSWCWRRPPRTKSRPGKLFLSTQQAYNAMKKESA